MCRYVVHNFLCGARKMKIKERCPDYFVNYHSIEYCKNLPPLHADADWVFDDHGNLEHTYGPGICSNENCRARWGLTDKDPSMEDDVEFDMSETACIKREERWYRDCLNLDQQLDAYKTEFPISKEKLSWEARVLLYWEDILEGEWANDLLGQPLRRGEPISAFELNPRYMTPRQLQTVTGYFLTPYITDTRISRDVKATTPRLATHGPFAQGSHKCTPKKGFCRKCGAWNGRGEPAPPTCHGNNFNRQLERWVQGALNNVGTENFMQNFRKAAGSKVGNKWYFPDGKIVSDSTMKEWEADFNAESEAFSSRDHSSDWMVQDYFPELLGKKQNGADITVDACAPTATPVPFSAVTPVKPFDEIAFYGAPKDLTFEEDMEVGG